MTVGRRSLLILLLLAFALLAAACASKAGAPEPPKPPAETSAIVAATPTITASAGASTIEATPGPSATAGASITIDAVGDISLGRQIVDRMNENGPDYPYALIAPLIDADIGFANLEGALTEGGTPWPKGYNFRTPPPLAAGLSRAHFNVVTLANNHTMDYGPYGLADTLRTLDSDGVPHV